MSYVYMDHAGWMERQLSYLRCKKKRKNDKPIPDVLSPFQRSVVTILGIVGCGIYNAPIGKIESIDWDYGKGVSVSWTRDLSTFDFDQLTILVFLCHEARIRLDIASKGPGRLRLTFHQRDVEGGIAIRHPNLDEAVDTFRSWFKPDHILNYKKQGRIKDGHEEIPR